MRNIIDNARQMGRIVALISALFICAGIYIPGAWGVVEWEVSKELGAPWLILLTAAFTFYFTASSGGKK